MAKTLIFGYGNLDREDDGVAWHMLAKICAALGREVPTDMDGFEPQGSEPDLLFRLQITPELAETIAEFDRVCFIDAHTGSVPEEIHMENIGAEFQASPFTHHMTPHTCMAFVETLYGKTPEAILVSVRGYSFEFERRLSPKTEALSDEAVKSILNWYRGGEISMSQR